MLRLFECLLLALKEEHPSSVVVKVPMEALNMVSGKTADGLAWNYFVRYGVDDTGIASLEFHRHF